MRLRNTTSKPDFAATSATPEPMMPEPTTPIRFMFVFVPMLVPTSTDPSDDKVTAR